MSGTRLRSVFIATITLIATVGCASKAPVRPAYNGADGVGALSADMLIGNWNVTVLNPHQGEQGGVTSVSYSEDGTVVMNADTDGQGIDMQLKMTGSWQIQGELVSQTLESIEETSGSALGVLVKPLLSAMKERSTGTANVYEATADRVVLVSSEDGQALEYTRLP